MEEIHGVTVDDVVEKIMPRLTKPIDDSGRIFIKGFKHMKYHLGHARIKLSSLVRRLFDTDERVKPIKSSKHALQRGDLSLLFRYAALGRYFSGFHGHTLGSDILSVSNQYSMHSEVYSLQELMKDKWTSPERKAELAKSGKYKEFPVTAFRLAEEIYFSGRMLNEIYLSYICPELVDWNIFHKKPQLIPDSHSLKQANEFLNLGKIMQSYMRLIKYTFIDQLDIINRLENSFWAEKKDLFMQIIQEDLNSLMDIYKFEEMLTKERTTPNANLYSAASKAIKLMLKRKEFGWFRGKQFELLLEQLPRDQETNLNREDLTAIMLNLFYDYNQSIGEHNRKLYVDFKRKHGIKEPDSMPKELWKQYRRQAKPFEYNFEITTKSDNNSVTLNFKDYHPSNSLINRLSAKLLENAGCKINQHKKAWQIKMQVTKAASVYEVFEAAGETPSSVQELYHTINAAHPEKSILLVEDDDRFLIPMINWMESLGIGKIYTAKTLADAKRIYNKHDLGVIVLDLNLPVSKKQKEIRKNLGFKLAEKVNDIPIIYSTAASHDAILQEAHNLLVQSTSEDKVKRKPYAIVEKGLRNEYIEAVANLIGIKPEIKKLPKPEVTVNPAYLGKKILIAEDQEGFLTTLENILISAGVPSAQIYKAANGKQAIKRLENNPDIALTITDLRMPEIDGIQFLAIYSSIFKDQRPIIVVTGSYSNEEVANLFQAKSLDQLNLNLKYTIKGKFFSDNIRKLVDKALTQPKKFSKVKVRMPESIDTLPRVHSLDYLEELAVQRRGELYVLETNSEELSKLLPVDELRQLSGLKTDFKPPKSLELTNQHDYKTEIAAVLVDNEERVRTIDATIKSKYEAGQIPRSDYGKILTNLSLIEQATRNAYDYTIQIVRHLAETDESAYSNISINSLIQRQLLPEFRKKYSKVNFDYESSKLPKLETSKKALAECLKAVIDNAASYGSRVNIATSFEDGHVLIRVEDNGPGIKKNLRNRIFEPLFTTRSQEGGTGVGLSLAKSYITKLGGEINYVPQKSGACFEIKLQAA